MVLRPLRATDWPEVAEIYLAGLESQLESYPPRFTDWESWDRGHPPAPRLVAEENGSVVGWAALVGGGGPARPEDLEVNVYVAKAARGRGVGGALLGALVRAADDQGIPLLRASVFTRNQASMRLHSRHGFHPVGFGEPEPGLEDRWLETVFLERTRPIGAALETER
jgi:phosphinothricin acetyltransferase